MEKEILRKATLRLLKQVPRYVLESLIADIFVVAMLPDKSDTLLINDLKSSVRDMLLLPFNDHRKDDEDD